MRKTFLTSNMALSFKGLTISTASTDAVTTADSSQIMHSTIFSSNTSSAIAQSNFLKRVHQKTVHKFI